MAQNHTNPRAACQPERTGTAQHHKPNVTRAALKTRKPRARSWLIRLLTKRAGANTSNNLVTYSSIECAACARIRDRKTRSEEHTSELQSRGHLVCRLLLEKKKKKKKKDKQQER